MRMQLFFKLLYSHAGSFRQPTSPFQPQDSQVNTKQAEAEPQNTPLEITGIPEVT